MSKCELLKKVSSASSEGTVILQSLLYAKKRLKAEHKKSRNAEIIIEKEIMDFSVPSASRLTESSRQTYSTTVVFSIVVVVYVRR